MRMISKTKAVDYVDLNKETKIAKQEKGGCNLYCDKHERRTLLRLNFPQVLMN